ncbi:MAG: SDR family NAD(P)-dependent oxidoreductase [Gammaproteobacteria bacterium]
MTRLLEGRNALVSGAARGIGLACARTLAQAGAAVTLTDIDEAVLEAEAATIRSEGLDVTAHQMDVSSGEDLARVFANVQRLDVLVNNAAIIDAGRAQDVSLERWREVLEVNLTSALAVTQAALPALRLSSAASIVNVASTQSLFGQPASAAYASAKGGLASLTRCLAVDLGEEGIRANAVAPGFIDTRMALMADGQHEHELPAFRDFYRGEGKIPLRRAGQPTEVADAIVFLASDLSRYVTGQILAIDGGLSATY